MFEPGSGLPNEESAQLSEVKQLFGFEAVLRIRIHRIHMFLGLPDPDPLVRGMDRDPDPDVDPDPDPSFIMQKW